MNENEETIIERVVLPFIAGSLITITIISAYSAAVIHERSWDRGTQALERAQR